MVLFLVSPPAIRFAIHCNWLDVPREVEAPNPTLVRKQSELIGLLRNRLREVNRDIQLLTSAKGLIYDPSGGPGGRGAARYRIAAGDVLAYSTPSPTEKILCVSFYGLPPMGKETSVLFEDHLVGRLLDPSDGSGIGRVQTILDPLFRVRFVCGEDVGMLWGTGRTDRDGYPLLEVHHLGKPPGFKLGDTALTEGGDGRYPSGCLLGRVVEMAGPKEARAIIRSGIQLDSLRQVTLLQDMAMEDLAHLEGGSR